MKRFVMLLLMMVLLVGCGGAAATSTPVTVATDATETPADAGAPSEPTSEPTATEAAVVPGASADLVEVVSHTVTRPAEGSAVILGIVRNKSSSPIAGITVQAQVQDAGGATVASGQDQLLAQAALRPGVQAPFMIMISQEVPADAKVSFEAAAQVYDPQTMLSIGTPYADLELEGDTLTKTDGGTWDLTGRIKNTGTKTARVYVLAAAYDAAGNMSEVGLGVVPLAMAPGTDSPITVSFLGAAGGREDPVKYEVTILGSEQP